MALHRVLAFVDVSPSSRPHAAWRAARLAWAQGAELHLLSRVCLPDGHPSSRHGSSAPPVRARALLADLARQMQQTLGIVPAITVLTDRDPPAWLDRVLQASALVVLDDAGTPAGCWRGRRLAMAGKVLREVGVPVFIARRAPGAAHRLALAVVGPDTASADVVLQATRWFCAPEAIVACQVLDPGVRRHLLAADLPLPAVQAWTDTARARAEKALALHLVRHDLDAAQARVLAGPPLEGLAAEQQRTGASLMVLGRPRRTRWQDLLRPGLAQRLAQRVRCDLLWLPTPVPTALAARDRLAGLRSSAA